MRLTFFSWVGSFSELIIGSLILSLYCLAYFFGIFSDTFGFQFPKIWKQKSIGFFNPFFLKKNMVTTFDVFFWYLKHLRVKMVFSFFCKIYSSHFEKWTFLKCPILKSDPISFSDFLGVPLIISLNLFCHTFFIQNHFFENIFHYFFAKFIFLFFTATTQSNQCQLSEFFICGCIIYDTFRIC